MRARFSPWLLVLAWASLLSGCVDPIDLEVGQEEKRLVVDGLITDEEGPYTVRLTRTAAFQQGLEGLTENVRGARVRIEDDAGQSALLREETPGVYRTAPGELRGQVGRSYTVHIETEGERYRSRPEQMMPVPLIESIDIQFVENVELSEQNVPVGEKGYQVFVDTRDLPEQGNYYRWMVEGIFELHTDALASEVCWIPERLSGIFIADDALINGNAIVERPLGFVPVSYKVLWSYAAKVRQLSLTAEAFAFWELIQQQVQQSGTIFAPPPDRIRGNVENLDDPERFALGYFGASAVSMKRDCFEIADFEERPIFVPMVPTVCPPNEIPKPSYWDAECES